MSTVRTAVRVLKAQSSAQTTPDLLISAVEEIRSDTGPDWQLRNMATFVRDASAITDALYVTLPGGTLDQILRLMLERKASQ